MGKMDCEGQGAIPQPARPAKMFLQTPWGRLNRCSINMGRFLMKISMPCSLWHLSQGFWAGSLLLSLGKGKVQNAV